MKKILVIEDEQVLQKNIMKILRLEGFEVMGASDGETGGWSVLVRSPRT